MEINPLASSSSGNCYIVGDSGSKIMIDCGIPLREIRIKGDFKVHEIQGCLLSHEHF